MVFKVPLGKEVIIVTRSNPRGDQVRESVLGSNRMPGVVLSGDSSCRVCLSVEEKGILLWCDGCDGVFHSECVGHRGALGAGAAWHCAICRLKLDDMVELDLAPRDVLCFLSLSWLVGLKEEGLQCRQPPISIS